MTRLQAEPLQIQVKADENTNFPLSFQWEGRQHRVKAVVQYWQIDMDWWLVQIWRDFFKVITDTGLLATIYYDLIAGCWMFQRMYD